MGTKQHGQTCRISTYTIEIGNIIDSSRKPYFLAIFSLLIFGCGSEEPKQIETQKPKETLGQQLALIEFNKSVPSTDPYVIKLDSMINLLSSSYREPKDSIAEYTQKCNAVLASDHIEETNLDLMIGVHNMGNVPNTKYKEAILLIAVMIKAQNNSK
jgi:hypothetical protein